MFLYVRCCTIVAALTLVTYDYILTFRDEVDLVWNRPITMGTALFALNRYLPFVDLPIMFQLYLGSTKPDPNACRNLSFLSGSSILFSLFCSETMLVLRTIAIWNCRRFLTVGLCVLNSAAILSTLAVTISYEITFRYVAVPRHSPEPCFVSNYKEAIVYAPLIPVLTLETAVFVLTMIKAYHHLQNNVSSWVHQMYRGGFLCFALTFTLSLLNFLLPWLAPPHLKFICVDIQRVSHSIICNRLFFLLLRQKETTKTRDSKGRPALNFYSLTVDDFTIPNDFEVQDQDASDFDLESRNNSSRNSAVQPTIK